MDLLSSPPQSPIVLYHILAAEAAPSVEREGFPAGELVLVADAPPFERAGEAILFFAAPHGFPPPATLIQSGSNAEGSSRQWLIPAEILNSLPRARWPEVGSASEEGAQIAGLPANSAASGARDLSNGAQRHRPVATFG